MTIAMCIAAILFSLPGAISGTPFGIAAFAFCSVAFFIVILLETRKAR